MKLKNIKTYLSSLMACAVLVSCNVPDNDVSVKSFVPGEVENPVTLTQVIIKDPNLSILESLMRRIEASATTPSAKVLSQLNLPGNTTIFVPTNDAFEAFKKNNSITNLDNLPIELITNLVMNHILTGKFLAADFSTGYISTQATRTSAIVADAVNLSMYVNTTNGVVLNGTSKIVKSDMVYNNGVIHFVDAVINVPTVRDLITIDPAFSTLNEVVLHADSGLTTPVNSDLLKSTGSFTIFAPTNTAFTNVLLELDPTGAKSKVQDLLSTQASTLIRFHSILTGNAISAISSNLFASKSNAALQTVLSGTVGRINFDGKLKTIKDPRSRIANITPKDIQGSNGVIHSIDKVILPVLF